MAFFDRFRRKSAVQAQAEAPKKIDAVGATSEYDIETLTSFDNSNITYSSELSSVDYDAILRDKQNHITDLYRLSDYYTDSDAVCSSIVKQVYMPYATNSKWYLTGNQKTIRLYEDYYKQIRLREKIDDIMLNYFKYANVFIYVWEGNVMVLPPHKCVIGNVSLNGTPTVFFDVESIATEYKYKTFTYKELKQVDDDDLDTLYDGYPPEIADAVKSGHQYAQLSTENCFVLQGPKEGWMRYSIPWIAAALPALAKKELISAWETNLLNLSQRSFVHVQYGDNDINPAPDIGQLRQVRNIFSSAMSGNPLAVTNHLAKASVVTTDISNLYQWPLYRRVNADVMAAGGIAGILATGQSEDGSTFASAQVSIQTASSRIEAARREVEDFMNKLNRRLAEDISQFHTNNMKNIPEFHFAPFDIAGQKSMRETCMSLWENGLISTRTLMEMNGFSIDQEKKERELEAENGTDEVLAKRDGNPSAPQDETEEEGQVGRPKLDDEDRKSDPQNAIRSKQVQDTKEGDIPQEQNVGT